MVVGSLRLVPRWSLITALFVVVVVGGVACTPTEVGPGVVACSDSDPCADGSACVDGKCEGSCVSAGCERGVCDEVSGECVGCIEATDCGPGQVCDASSRTCVLENTGCRQDSDCARGFCDTGTGACVGCRGDDDCGVDQGCDGLTRECVVQTGCDADADCTAPTPVCNIDRAICVECLANEDCSTGRCDVASSTCIAGCVDTDSTEPNDGANAAPIASGGEHSGRICAGDVDEFVFEAEGAIEASINVDGGVLALTLLNSAGTALATSQGTVGIGGLPAGTYRLRVAGAATTEADYVLRLNVTPPEGCVELDSEPNNSVATASELPTTGVLRSGTICGDDVDLWSFAVDAGDDVTVTLVGGEGAGTATVTLESTSGVVLANGTTTSPARIDGAAAGTVIARVRATGGDVGYSLRVTTSSAPPACVQIDAEPNDTAAQAIALVPGTAANGQICANDIDQYRFSANALDDLAVNITGSNVRVRVLNSGGSVVAEGTTSFTSADLAAGTYRIEVRGALATTEASYSINIVLTPQPAADVCAEGGLEPDSATNARPIAIDGTSMAGRICTNDTDFFTFTLTETRNVVISTRFIDDDGDIDIRLKQGTTTVATTSGVGNEELISRSLNAGTYVVEVFGYNGAVNTYSISVTAAVANCTDDAFEPNDTIARAAPISGRAVSGTRCPGNDDFFALRLESGDSLDARLTGTGLTMSLVSSTGAVLQSDAADGSNRRLQVSSLAAGRYFVRITGSAVASASYTLTPTIVPSPSRCIDDGAEINNSTATPFVVDAGLFADGSYDLSALTICSGNPDFFALDIPANRTVRFDLAHATANDLDVLVHELRGTSGLTRAIASGIALEGTLDDVSGTTTAAVRLLVQVVGYGVPSAGVAYGLGIELSTPSTGTCVNDRFDSWSGTDEDGRRTFNNNARTDSSSTDLITTVPTPLSFPENLPSQQICVADVDVYALNVTQGQRFTVTASYTHSASADIDIRVFGPDDSNSPADSDSQVDLLSCSTCAGTSGTETFTFTATKSGTHFVEVFEYQNDGSNSYDLSVQLN